MIAIAPAHKAQLSNYTSWLTKRGFPFYVLKKEMSLEGFSMLILCGGPDVGKNPERDFFEKKWFELAYGKIPVLGICRGLQISNVLLGGTLHSDLGTTPIMHSANLLEIAGEPKNLESSWHNISYNEKTIKVNSRHHQGIDKLGRDLIPLAYCTDDNLIEMAEGNKSLFVQWHPEREDVWGTDAESIVYEWIKNNIKQNSPVDNIRLYLTKKGFTVVSNDTIRKNIDSNYNDEFLFTLINENSQFLKKVIDKNGKTAVKMIK